MNCKMGMVALLCAALVQGALAGELPSIFGERQEQMQVWPLAAGGDDWEAPSLAVAEGATEGYGKPEKSPRRAFLLSLLLPGAGEFYAGSKKKAAIFFGIEAVAVGLYFSSNGKGNDVEDEFRAVADAHWDVEAYLAWRSTTRAIRNNSFTHALPCSSYVETYLETGKFSGCSSSEVQQYYELLGKYDQFVAGWDDLQDERTGNPVTAYTEIDSVENVVSELRFDYEVRRDDSNKYLKRATNISGLLLVNHVISAIDAARTARGRAQGVDPATLERRTRFLFTLHQGSRGEVPMLMAYKPFD